MLGICVVQSVLERVYLVVMRSMLLLSMLFVGGSSRAVQGTLINTYHGVPITAQTILELTPSPTVTLQHAITVWLYAYKPLIMALVHAPVHDAPNVLKERSDVLNECIRSCGLQNVSKWNFVMPVELTVDGELKRYLVKIAGPVNRRENYNKLLGKSASSVIALSEYQSLVATHRTATYQHISRVACWLRLREWYMQNLQAQIFVPRVYLIHIPGQPSMVSDENYIVLEEWVNSIGTPDTHPHIFLAALSDLKRAAAYAGLWDIASKQFVITQDNKVAPIDFELPHDCNPEDFFNGNAEKCAVIVRAGQNGLDSLAHTLQKAQQKAARSTFTATCRQWIYALMRIFTIHRSPRSGQQ